MGTATMDFGEGSAAGSHTQRRGGRKLPVGLRKGCGGNAENIDLPKSQRILERVEWTQRKFRNEKKPGNK
ncbi:MAG: hypothetical protein KGH58_00640 [Candidatus Micrarchaeota archaeon]|nr:hypothetical protein [Candidatus Micrarchaeota archaeon]